MFSVGFEVCSTRRMESLQSSDALVIVQDINFDEDVTWDTVLGEGERERGCKIVRN